MWKDLALAFRALRRSPLFTAAAVVSLALGIGANTAIFSLLDQVVLRSLPVRDPQSLVLLHTRYNAPGSSSSDNNESVFSYPMYRDLRDRDPAFSALVARMSGGVRLAYQGATESASAEMVSGNFFQALGVGAAMGRVIAPQDDGPPGAHPVIVLSHSYWSSHFGNRPAILNQTFAVNGHPMVAIGVAEARFHGIMPGDTPDFFVPIAMQREILPTLDALADRRMRWLNLLARLKPGIGIRQAQAATDVTYRAILQTELPAMGRMSSDRDRDEFLNHPAELRPAAQGVGDLRERWQKPLVALMTLVALVLLIACFNVASLMLARAAGRRREIAIRVALGAGRGVLLKQLLLEGIIVALGGAALGLAVAYWSTAAMVKVLPTEYGAWLETGFSVPMLAFNFAVAAGCGLLFGLIPALEGARANLAATLKDLSQAVASGGSARFRKALVIGQLALSLLLVAGAGLFGGSLANLLHLNLGFRSQRLVTFTVNATLTRPKTADAVAFYRDLQTRLASLPGVTGVAAAIGGPLSGSDRGNNLTIEGYQAAPDELVGSSVVAVGPGFFRALSIPLRAGREFTGRDDAAAPKTVLVNEAFARRYFAGRNPVGRHLMFGGGSHPVLDREIVGVAADSRTEVRTPPKITVYMPYAQWVKPERLMFYLRTAGDQTRLAGDIRRVVREADPNLPIATIQPLEVRIRERLYTDRLIAMLSTAFGVLATLLAAIGLYGVIAYAVTRRTSEIGIRMALGAVPANVLRLILREAAAMAALGIAIGLAAALALSRLVQSQLFGVEAADPRVYAAAAACLAAVALLAAAIPALRAARIDPVKALKYE
jgi:predicted permease